MSTNISPELIAHASKLLTNTHNINAITKQLQTNNPNIVTEDIKKLFVCGDELLAHKCVKGLKNHKKKFITIKKKQICH